MSGGGTEYRIEYAIQRKRADEDDFTEIGFGSSGAGTNLDDCTYAIESYVSHGQWETTTEHPDPDDIMREIQEATR